MFSVAIYQDLLVEEDFMLSSNNSPSDVVAQLTINKTLKHHTAVTSSFELISTAYPPHPSWDANPEWTIFSRTS